MVDRLLCPDSFNGTDHSVASEFLSRFKLFAEFKNWSGIQKAKAFQLFMKESAFLWLNNLKDSDLSDFECIQNKFKERYVHKIPKWNLLSKFHNRKLQVGECLDHYLADLTTLATDLNKTEDNLKETFIQGLPARVKSLVVIQKPTSRNTAVELAKLAYSVEDDTGLAIVQGCFNQLEMLYNRFVEKEYESCRKHDELQGDRTCSCRRRRRHGRRPTVGRVRQQHQNRKYESERKAENGFRRRVTNKVYGRTKWDKGIDNQGNVHSRRCYRCEKVCRDGKYGINCSTWCGHCADNRTCDKTTGHCPGACMDGWVGRKCDAIDCNCEEECIQTLPERCKACKGGWYGPFCEKKNVALNGIASQKGTYIFGIPMTADLAVDGNINTNPYKRSCAHTDERNNSWWSVQLEDNGINQIRYMKIYNPEKHYIWRRKGMEILVDGKRCKKWPDNEIPRTIEDVTCRETLTGHNLTITVPGQYYSVCEVQVFVCSDGWFGEDCDKQCNCLYSNDVCDKVTGRCKRGCEVGYMGADCQKLCRDGWYGENCSSTCGHCMKGPCNHTSGDCHSACVEGWNGRKCDDSDSMWHFVLKIVWAVGTGLFAFFLLFAGIIFCLLLLWRLHSVRKTAGEPGQASCDHVEMSDVTRPPASLNEAPASSGNIGADDNIYDVIPIDLYGNN